MNRREFINAVLLGAAGAAGGMFARLVCAEPAGNYIAFAHPDLLTDLQKLGIVEFTELHPWDYDHYTGMGIRFIPYRRLSGQGIAGDQVLIGNEEPLCFRQYRAGVSLQKPMASITKADIERMRQTLLEDMTDMVRLDAKSPPPPGWITRGMTRMLE